MKENWFCPLDKCEHYGKATKYDRKCYYEPQCWRGYIDMGIMAFTLCFKKKSKQDK